MAKLYFKYGAMGSSKSAQALITKFNYEELGMLVGQRLALPIALATIAAIVAVNARGSRTAGAMQVVSTVCKLAPLAVLIVCGFALGGGGNPVVTPLVGPGTSVGAALGSTLLAVLFAFEGWTNVGAIAGELRDPARDLPRAIVGGVSIANFLLEKEVDLHEADPGGKRDNRGV